MFRLLHSSHQSQRGTEAGMGPRDSGGTGGRGWRKADRESLGGRKRDREGGGGTEGRG